MKNKILMICLMTFSIHCTNNEAVEYLEPLEIDLQTKNIINDSLKKLKTISQLIKEIITINLTSKTTKKEFKLLKKMMTEKALPCLEEQIKYTVKVLKKVLHLKTVDLDLENVEKTKISYNNILDEFKNIKGVIKAIMKIDFKLAYENNEFKTLAKIIKKTTFSFLHKKLEKIVNYFEEVLHIQSNDI